MLFIGHGKWKWSGSRPHRMDLTVFWAGAGRVRRRAWTCCAASWAAGETASEASPRASASTCAPAACSVLPPCHWRHIIQRIKHNEAKIRKLYNNLICYNQEISNTKVFYCSLPSVRHELECATIILLTRYLFSAPPDHLQPPLD